MHLEEFLETLKSDPTFANNVAFWGFRKKQKARYVPIPDELHPLLREYLNRQGIDRLYTHQAEVYNAVNAIKDVVITTPTASPAPLLAMVTV